MAEEVKIGLEIHQQLDTCKLFCNCPTELTDTHDFTFTRFFRPTHSELGGLDRAALQEFRKGRKVVYHANLASSCAVEWDEEPPHPLNTKALEIALQFTRMMASTPVDEIQVMRKILIDGSAVSGFQRTALVATGGVVPGTKVRVDSICLEEDSSRPVNGEHLSQSERVFNVDRLGTPLIEVATLPDITSGEQAREVALKIGEALRMLKVKRGLGTIRQDINISIPDGARVEIKGVQDLSLIPKLVEFEVNRQKRLFILSERIRQTSPGKPLEVTGIFTKTDSKIFKGQKVFAMTFSSATGLFAEPMHPGKHLGRELAEYVRAHGFRGFVHTDEDMTKYKLESELEAVKKIMGCRQTDLLALSAGSAEPLNLVAERLSQLVSGVTEDTRKCELDGSSSFLRPLPTGARMYPETDIPPIKPFRVPMPETPEQRLVRLKKVLPEQLALKLHISPDYNLFCELGGHPFLGEVFTEHLPALRRRGLEVNRSHLEQLVHLYKGQKGGALLDLLQKVVKGEEMKSQVSDEVVRQFVKSLVHQKQDFIKNTPSPEKGLMGLVMQEFRGRFPGQQLLAILKEELEKVN